MDMVLCGSNRVGDINVFLTSFKQRIIDTCLQEWNDVVNSSSKLEFFHKIKDSVNMLQPEKYLLLRLNKKYKTALTRFRCSNHSLQIEVGRHQGLSKEERLCIFCLETLGKCYVEDEFHMLFVCYLYGELRGKLLPKWCVSYPNERKMLRLMSHSSPAIVSDVALFVYEAMKLRNCSRLS